MSSVKKYGASWRYTLELEPDSSGKRRQVQKSGFRTKAAAQAALEKAEELAKHGVQLDRALTYGDWLDLWLASKMNIRERTREGYRSHVRLYLKPPLVLPRSSRSHQTRPSLIRHVWMG